MRSRAVPQLALVAGVALAAGACGVVLAAPPHPQGPGLGVPLDAARAAAWDRTVTPDGAGLPPGSGTVPAGGELYARLCAACHGPDGVGDTADELAGGRMPLTSDTPDKTIGTYWPYATTLFDFIRRSMPANAPGSLADDEVYALTAWLLWRNGIVGRDAVLDAPSLAAVRMPNRDGFVRQWPEAR